jgi:hypothetical protein
LRDVIGISDASIAVLAPLTPRISLIEDSPTADREHSTGAGGQAFGVHHRSSG